MRLRAKKTGHLIPDYLCSVETGHDYLKDLKLRYSQYKPFKLVLVDIKENPIQARYLENYNLMSESELLNIGIHSFDNSDNREQPWQKTIQGQKQFHNLIKVHPYALDGKILTNKLIDLLNDKTQYFPDDQLEKQLLEIEHATDLDTIKRRSAINVFSPRTDCGTRTNTVILVDFHGNCTFVERTLETPVDVDDPKWKTVEFSFELDL